MGLRAKTIAVALIASLFACPGAIAADGSAAPEVRIPTVTVARADTTEVVSRIPVSGTLVPREEVLVNPQINGYAIDRINVDIGDRVDQGQVLAVLNDSALSAQLAQAEAELLRAKGAVGQAENQIESARASMKEADAKLDRTQQLASSGNVSQATLDQSKSAAASARAAFKSAENGLDVARAQVAQAASQRDLAKINLERVNIKAPVAGIVSARTAKLGAIAASGGDPMFRIIRGGEVEVEAEVIETALGRVETGDPAEVTVAGVGNVEGKVRLISPTVDQSTRLGTIRISLEQNDAMRTGTFASGWIVTDRHMATTVPSAAVLNDLSGTTVEVVEDGIVHVRDVTAGLLSEDGRREIVKGLTPGETVIARAGAFFGDGDKVDPVMPDKTTDEDADKTDAAGTTSEGADEGTGAR